jgi:hypothetical protein
MAGAADLRVTQQPNAHPVEARSYQRQLLAIAPVQLAQ